MVDIQHGALRAFEEHGLAVVEGVIDQLGGVADIAANFFAERESFFDFVREIDVGAVGSLGEAIFFGDDVGGFLAEQLGIQQVAHAQAAASHLVFVGGTDAARGRADFVGAARAFGGFVQLAMVGKNQMGAIADVQAAIHVDAGLARAFRFR